MPYARSAHAPRPRLQRLLLALSLVWCLFLVAPGSSSLAAPPAGRAGSLIVVFAPHQAEQHAVAAVRDEFGDQGLRALIPLGVDGPTSGAPAYLGTLAARADAGRLAAALERSPLVLSAEPNASRRFSTIDPQTGPADAEFARQPYYFDIGVVAMWARGVTGGSIETPITIAVIDTGVDLDHPDIDANLATGYDFVNPGTPPQDTSTTGHGSAVTGIIAAEMNNDIADSAARGVAGIAGGDAQAGTPGLRVMPLRVVADITGELDCAMAARAIDYARQNGAHVINMSFGGPEECALECAAVQRAYDAGIALVAAAGNGNSSIPFYPAACGAGISDNQVIAVAGLFPSGTKTSSSNYGAWVDIAAPGWFLRSLTNDGGYASYSGTSFATPLVSGLIGVLMANYGWSHERAIRQVRATADRVDDANPDYRGQLGAGRINADRASRLVNDVYVPLLRR